MLSSVPGFAKSRFPIPDIGGADVRAHIQRMRIYRRGKYVQSEQRISQTQRPRTMLDRLTAGNRTAVADEEYVCQKSC